MKPMRKNNNPRKNVSAFFRHFLGESGEDFLIKENPVSLKRKSTMFFRDIANGSFDLEKQGQYLSDERLLNTMLDEAIQKLKYYDIHHRFSIIALQAQPNLNSTEVQNAVRADYDSLMAYQTIVDCLIAVLNTKNLSYFQMAANKMMRLKYSL